MNRRAGVVAGGAGRAGLAFELGSVVCIDDRVVVAGVALAAGER